MKILFIFRLLLSAFYRKRETWFLPFHYNLSFVKRRYLCPIKLTTHFQRSFMLVVDKYTDIEIFLFKVLKNLWIFLIVNFSPYKERLWSTYDLTFFHLLLFMYFNLNAKVFLNLFFIVFQFFNIIQFGQRKERNKEPIWKAICKFVQSYLSLDCLFDRLKLNFNKLPPIHLKNWYLAIFMQILIEILSFIQKCWKL